MCVSVCVCVCVCVGTEILTQPSPNLPRPSTPFLHTSIKKSGELAASPGRSASARAVATVPGARSRKDSILTTNAARCRGEEAGDQ